MPVTEGPDPTPPMLVSLMADLQLHSMAQYSYLGPHIETGWVPPRCDREGCDELLNPEHRAAHAVEDAEAAAAAAAEAKRRRGGRPPRKRAAARPWQSLGITKDEWVGQGGEMPEPTRRERIKSQVKRR